MSKNAMAGAITLCGVGLCTIGGGLMMQSGSAAHAGSMPLAAIAAATHTQAGPTIVWMGVTDFLNYAQNNQITYHRLWSDGRLEMRTLRRDGGTCAPTLQCTSDWVEVPPPAGGNGFACRTDVNGDRIVDGADLSIMLNAWGDQGGCEPEATYPCLDLTNLASGMAVK